MDLLDVSHPGIQPGTDRSKDICIIGAGPAGLAAAKVIVETSHYPSGLWRPIIFEEKDKVGGIWVPAPPVDDPPLTPLYDSLTTNLPHPVMSFESFPFPPSTPVFPHFPVVQQYLEAYAEHFGLVPLLRLRTAVVDARWDQPTGKWNVTLSTDETLAFDLVIVANGHYRVPRYPALPGLPAWRAANKIMHSAWYRRPQPWGATVLVVGGGPSGQDISAEMRAHARLVIHAFAGAPPGQDGNLRRRGRVVAFRPGGEVLFDDGAVETGVDFCILATGYEMRFPFLSELQNAMPPRAPPLPDRLYNSTFHLFPLAKHVFPLQTQFPAHTLAFLGLPVRVAPFPLVEAQARAVLKVFAQPGALDPTEEAVEIMARYEALRAECAGSEPAIAKAFHRFVGREQFDYRDQLNHFADPAVDRRIQPWVIEMYEKKDVLRKVWRALEASGEAAEWVKDVGRGGNDEWVELLRKMLRKAEEDAEVADGQPAAVNGKL